MIMIIKPANTCHYWLLNEKCPTINEKAQANINICKGHDAPLYTVYEPIKGIDALQIYHRLQRVKQSLLENSII